MTRRRATEDQGFTLIELLVTVIILGVITIPLGNLVIEYFLNSARTQARFHESHDSQVTAAFFSQDVASIGLRNQSTQNLTQSVWTSSIGSAPLACSTGITPFLALAWDEFDSTGARTTVVVEYGTRSQVVGTQTQTQLIRLHCTGSATPDATSVLAHDLAGTPTVTCAGNGATSCNDPSNIPVTVTMNLSIHDPDNPGSAYAVSVSGERRQT
jgi:prepilin-type N-terminal cleavage/methylation domain-containing protein